MLLFKKRFLEAIRQGTKVQTIRLWKHCRAKAGQRSYIPGVGYIRITAVDCVPLEALTDEDAVADGFDSADALRAEIARLYGEIDTANVPAYRVRFRSCTPEETAQALADKAARKAAKQPARRPAKRRTARPAAKDELVR